jgi:hypothetical protein|tara:strand:- start:109 stop:648 length:540 start_codon:yes stop_codon:yes gene_type:complete
MLRHILYVILIEWSALFTEWGGVMVSRVENKYTEHFDQLIAECRFLPKGITREKCCEEQGIPMNECPEPYVPVERSFWERHGEELVMVSVLVIASIVTAIVAARWLKRASRADKRSAATILVGWFLWIAAVTVVVLLFHPYGSTMYEDEYVNMGLWFTLPPLLFLSVFWWWKRFFKSGE